MRSQGLDPEPDELDPELDQLDPELDELDPEPDEAEEREEVESGVTRGTPVSGSVLTEIGHS
jgi:hypothetical protein